MTGGDPHLKDGEVAHDAAEVAVRDVRVAVLADALLALERLVLARQLHLVLAALVAHQLPTAAAVMLHSPHPHTSTQTCSAQDQESRRWQQFSIHMSI